MKHLSISAVALAIDSIMIKLTLFLTVVTTILLNFISSLMTATLPLAAAMCAHVIPF